MKSFLSSFARRVALLAALVALGGRLAIAQSALRPPAVPLVTFDPYLSIWSMADRLTDDTTRHWTHRAHALISLIRIDATTYRLMGREPESTPAFPQTGLKVTPTRSIYDFGDAHIHVTLTFCTPALPDELDVLARPLSYITWSVRSIDGAAHAVSLFDSTSAQIAVNEPGEPVTWSRRAAGALTILRAGDPAQDYFDVSGDDARIDWGYVYAAASRAQSAIGGSRALVAGFAVSGSLPAADDTRMPRPANDDEPALAYVFPLGQVGGAPVSRHVIVAYDEVYAIRYFGRDLRPFWRRSGANAETMLAAAERDYPRLVARCADFDERLMADLTRVGGAKYAQVAALAYRQSLAATGIAADANRQPLLFTKENTSNGDIATVDVIFPMDPVLLLLSPTLAKASVVPDLAYAASGHWRFPNAPHDLGTYPIARGTDDGGEGMPVEESGNMLLLCDAIAQEEGRPDFVAPWWNKLTQWAHYLEQYGNDPEDQLCTDDFMGHLAHNANLAVKAILGLAAFGDMCRMRGDLAEADRYRGLARTYARHWMAAASDGDHYRLAFDKPGTWSQKYNLVWDHILGLNVFPSSAASEEVAFYKTVLQPYGVPLDSRTRLTKTDWSYWSASLATSENDFTMLTDPIYRYLNETTAREPLVDSYVTDDIHSDGMHARPVVGGIFIRMLTDPAVWKRWSSRDTLHAAGWAPLPTAPRPVVVVPTSQVAPQVWRYTTIAPPDGWTQPAFDDSGWKSGPGGFGTTGTPGIAVGTTWSTDDIWIRRSFVMPAGAHPGLRLLLFHDEDIEVYINGSPAARAPGFITAYETAQISPQARALLRPGARITLAVHCHQTVGGQGVDVGLVDVRNR